MRCPHASGRRLQVYVFQTRRRRILISPSTPCLAWATAARPRARPRRAPPGLNRLPATVLRTEPGGGEVQVSLALAGGGAGAAQPDAHATLVAVVPQGCATTLALAPGQGVIACFDPASVILAVLA